MNKIRVRIAPSPTGNLHIGTARTALFNYLFARHLNGTMILRIEDTDLNRSTEESLKNIISGLKWLGIEWDEGPEAGGNYGPYFQSQKVERYREVLEELKQKGRVYEVLASEEEIAERAAKFRESKQYTPEKEQELINNLRTTPAYKFKAEKKDYGFQDLIKGQITVEAEMIEDLVLFKSDGMPTYNFAVVVDDIDMKITHVIRGDDHISNTPKQLMIYEALGVEPPLFGHLGMILAKDPETGSVGKMSKRHGATAIDDYRAAGYLPEAIFNYIAFLGWAPGTDQELFAKEELFSAFSIERISKSPSIFDREKLNWFNQQYFLKTDPSQLIGLAKPYFEEKGFNLDQFSPEKQGELALLAGKRVSLLADFPEETEYFFSEEIKHEDPEQKEILGLPESATVLDYAIKTLEQLEEWTPETLKEFLKKTQKELNLKARPVMMPLRIALSGKMHGADLFMIMYIMGKAEVLKRLSTCLQSLS